jgi:hypothetical protein
MKANFSIITPAASFQMLGIGPCGAAHAEARPSFGANSLGQSGIPFTRRSLNGIPPFPQYAVS